MKFQLLGDWPGPGNVYIEAGTILDGYEWQRSWPLPINAKALDQEALDALAYWYGEEQYHLLQRTPGLHLPAVGHPPPRPEGR